jgi:anaerobic selenocysteine-containing dehydrogenase
LLVVVGGIGAVARKVKIKPYKNAAGGWGSAQSLGYILTRELVPLSASPDLYRQNKPDGFACASRAWAKSKSHVFEYCENGAKATAWEITKPRCGSAFFKQHSVADMLTMSDFELEQAGSKVRAAMEKTYPELLEEMEERMWTPGGYLRPIKARQRVWQTDTKKANFITPDNLIEDPENPGNQQTVFRMMRSNDRFNTTVYGYNDRFRGIKGTRVVVLLNRDDMVRLGLQDGDDITLTTQRNDNVGAANERLSRHRQRHTRWLLRNILSGSQCAIAAVALCHGSFTPAAKLMPVKVVRT